MRRSITLMPLPSDTTVPDTSSSCRDTVADGAMARRAATNARVTAGSPR